MLVSPCAGEGLWGRTYSCKGCIPLPPPHFFHTITLMWEAYVSFHLAQFLYCIPLVSDASDFFVHLGAVCPVPRQFANISLCICSEEDFSMQIFQTPACLIALRWREKASLENILSWKERWISLIIQALKKPKTLRNSIIIIKSALVNQERFKGRSRLTRCCLSKGGPNEWAASLGRAKAWILEAPSHGRSLQISQLYGQADLETLMPQRSSSWLVTLWNN